MESGPPIVVLPSALRHGLSEAAVLHAYKHNIRAAPQDDEGVTMIVGGDQAGNLIEVGLVEADDGTVLIVHAMPARPKYRR